MEHENIGAGQHVVLLLVVGVKRNEGCRKCCLGSNTVKQGTPFLFPLELKAVEQVVAVH